MPFAGGRVVPPVWFVKPVNDAAAENATADRLAERDCDGPDQWDLFDDAHHARGGSASEPRWPFVSAESRDFDRRFMQQMAVHHDAGVRMATLVIDKDLEPETTALARLIVAEQTREATLLRDWWSKQQLLELRASKRDEARRTFLTLMDEHHRAAVKMTDKAWARAGEPRLRIFAYSAGYAQSGQIRWMRALATTVSVSSSAPPFPMTEPRGESGLRPR